MTPTRPQVLIAGGRTGKTECGYKLPKLDWQTRFVRRDFSSVPLCPNVNLINIGIKATCILGKERLLRPECEWPESIGDIHYQAVFPTRGHGPVKRGAILQPHKSGWPRDQMQILVRGIRWIC